MEIQNIYARARFQAALEQGLEQGREQGLEEGREQGLEKGRLEASRALLTKMIRLKFGAEAAGAVSAQIDEAKLESVEGWIERFVTASTLDEIFGAQQAD